MSGANTLETRIGALSAEKRALLQALRAAAAPAELAPRTPWTEVAPATAAQRRTWLVQEADPADTSANVRMAVRLEGRLALGALAASIERVVRRHEALRTGFRTDGVELVQVVRPPQHVALAVEHRPGLGGPERDEAAMGLVRGEADRPFDMRRDPLLRARVVAFDETDHVLTMTAHHAIIDGWSSAIVTRELTAAYAAIGRGEAPDGAPAPALQLADYAEWQRAWLRGRGRLEQLLYWRGRLRGAPVLDRLRPSGPGFARGHLALRLGLDASRRVRDLARAEGATVYMTLLAAYGALLARRFGVTDLVIGTPIAGRRDRRLEDSVGLFTNVVPLRLDLSGGPTFRTLLRRVRLVATEAFANQELPIEVLLRELGAGAAAARPPLFQVMFALHNYPTTPGSFPGLRGHDLRDVPSRLLEFYSPTATRVDLSLGIGDRADELGGVLEYNRCTVGDDDAAALAGEYARLVARAVETPDAALEGLAP